MTRRATEDDVEFILNHAEAFHASSPYGIIPFDRVAVEGLIRGLLIGGVIFVNDGGFLAAQVVPLMFNPRYKISNEIAWWCPDGDGQELRRAYEDWAKEEGAFVIQFSILNNERSQYMAKMLNDLDYRAIEIAYVKGVD